MNDRIENKDYLNFNEKEEIESLISIKSEEDKEDNIHLNSEDFAKLARRASGYDNGSSENFNFQKDASAEEYKENVDYVVDEEEQKVKLKSPYLKIIVGLLLTSFLIGGFVFFRSSYSKIIALSKNETEGVPQDQYAVDPKEKENEDLKAQLALIEQSKKDISPQPKPQPQPQPQPQANSTPNRTKKSAPAPTSRVERKPEPKPQPQVINPYQQWELLSKLGTLGDSSSLSQQNLSTENIEEKKTQTTSEVQTASSSNSSSVRPRLSEQEAVNLEPKNRAFSNPKVASTSLDSLNLSNNGSNQKTVDFEQKESSFSQDSKNVILSGLGISQANQTFITEKVSERSSKQIPIGQIIEGRLANTIAWSDNLNAGKIRGVINLIEPIKYSDGTIAVPKDSMIIAEIDSFNPNSFVTLNAIAITRLNFKGETLQQEIPTNTLLIRGRDNRPIKFETDNSDNGGSGLNQVLGGVIERNVRNLPVPRDVSSELSRALDRSGSNNRRERTYFIEAETPVSIYVNDLIHLER